MEWSVARRVVKWQKQFCPGVLVGLVEKKVQSKEEERERETNIPWVTENQ